MSVRFFRVSVICLFVLFGRGCLLANTVAKSQTAPNLIVIFCDNLGYGDIEPFGATVHRTPNLNRMATEGRKFTHFYVSSGVCTPSRASLMTGCYAQRVGMHHNPRDGRVLRPVSPYGLHPDEITIAEVLKNRGYATGIFGKWHLGDQRDFLPMQQGFDRFFGIPYSDDMTRRVGKRIGARLQGDHWPALPLMEGNEAIEAPTDRDLLTKRCTNEVLRFIDTNREHPFFVYFAQPMPGSTAAPFASPEFKGKSANGPWGDAIEEIDWSTGRILDKLVELKLDRQTLVIWLSDNGAPMGRNRDGVERGTNKPLNGRGYTTAEGAFRTPTIMWWPGQIPEGTTCTEIATTMDILPTSAALTGRPVEHNVDGYNIRSLLTATGKATSPTEAFFFYDSRQLQAVRSEQWKLFLPLETFTQHPHFKKGASKEPILFNVVNDVGCLKNVANNHPDVVSRLTRLAELARQDLGDVDSVGSGQRLAGRLTADQIAKPIELPIQNPNQN